MRRVPGAVAVNTLKKTALGLPENVNCLVVLGPTAVGKTALAVRLAEHFGGEILSCDSRQVYRGLDIGSGKDLCEYTVPYHLIDITDLSKEYSVFDYQKDFYRAFADVISRGKLPVIAGGTGLYIDSVVRSYHMQCVPENTELRKPAKQKRRQTVSTTRKLKSNLISRDRQIKAVLPKCAPLF